jgi:hypothetical protein
LNRIDFQIIKPVEWLHDEKMLFTADKNWKQVIQTTDQNVILVKGDVASEGSSDH